MEPEEFPGNAHKAKAGEPETRKNIKRVTSADPVRRKKPLGKQLSETFIGGDPKGAVNQMILGVLVPAAKDALVEAVTQGFEKLIFGESRRRSASPRPGGVSNYVSYNRMASRTDDRPPNPILSRRARARFEFEELAIPSRAEAEEVIEQMFTLLEQYDVVTVADLYGLTGVKAVHTDYKYGWTNLQGARAQRLRDGTYLLDLPEPEPLNN